MSQNRWDKISKKFSEDAGITSAEVKTFLEMNFTNGYHEKLCGTSASSPRLDPGLIMDLRHESVWELSEVNIFSVEQRWLVTGKESIAPRKLREVQSAERA